MKHVLLLLFCTPVLLFGCAGSAQGPLSKRVLQGSQGDVDVIVFSSTDCPIANAFAPELERINKEMKSRGGELFLVHVWEGRTHRDATQHANEYGLTMEVLIDKEHELVNMFNATTTPEVVVVSYDHEGEPNVVYQGPINNLFDSPGNRRDEATKHFLRDAIHAAFNNTQIERPYRKPIGCVIEQMQ